MLYLEDYLEVIEHLPLELRDRFTDIRERDLQVHNSTEQLKEKVKLFFAEAKKLKPEQRQCEYLKLLNEYQETMKYADDKELIAKQIHNILQKLVQRLDTELEKFKLELEADHAGITEELEKRSLELDSDNSINNHLNNSSNNTSNINSASTITTSKTPSGIKDRRRSEHKHRHHPYQNNQDNNGYNHGRAKLSHNEQHHNSSTTLPIHQSHFHQQNHHRRHGSKSNQNGAGSGRQTHSVNISPYNPGTYNHSISAPASIAEPDHLLNGSSGGVASDAAQTNGHYGSNLYSSIGNNSGFKKNSQNVAANITSGQQHSALSAALASTTTTTTTTSGQLNSVSAMAMMNASQVHNKISNNLKGNNQHNLMDPNSPLVRQNPLAAAASQAIAATQQLHQGRRTPSLKASFAAINAAGLDPLDSLSMPSGKQHDSLVGQNNRNALAPMAPDQQAFRCSNQFGKLTPNGSSSPLFISVTKSGRPTKRPKHHASHLYPDESPTSISSDNSVFENSESLSSADFIETGTTFGSASPSSLDFSNQTTQGCNTTLYHRDETKYCTCRQISYGEMVACDNDECEIEWFHYGCVGITQPPKGKWFCPDCTRKMNGHHHLHQQQSSHPQTQKKRGRKEKSLFNMFNKSLDVTTATPVSGKPKERVSNQSGKSVV